MLRLVEVLAGHRISYRRLAKAAGWSNSALRRLALEGIYPVRVPPDEITQRLRDALVRLGVSDEGALATAFDEVEVATARSNEPSPDAALGQQPEQPQEGVMLIRKQSVSPAAREFFGLKADALMPPWSREQVFLGGEMRVGYEHMLAKARYGGVLAIAAESGAGKSTLKDLLVTDLTDEGEVIVIEPHTQAMESDDKAGKTLKTAHICEAILRAVAPTQPIKRTTEGLLNQVAGALAASAEDSKRRHLLIIEEAHALPKPTLRHLKRFMEMKPPKRAGLNRPLLSIVLLGQPELTTRLSPFDMDVREVWQRCELVVLPPLNKELDAYLKFVLGASASAFTPEAIATLRAKLTNEKNGDSFLYPLAVNNWLAAILNQAAGLTRTITGETVAEVYADMQKSAKGAK